MRIDSKIKMRLPCSETYEPVGADLNPNQKLGAGLLYIPGRQDSTLRWRILRFGSGTGSGGD